MQLTSGDRVLGQPPFGGRRSQRPLRDWRRTAQWTHVMTHEVLLPSSWRCSHHGNRTLLDNTRATWSRAAYERTAGSSCTQHTALQPVRRSNSMA